MFELLLGGGRKLNYSIKPMPSQSDLGIYNTANVPGDNPGEVWIFGGITRGITSSRSAWLYNAETGTLGGPWIIPTERNLRQNDSIGKIGNMIYFVTNELITSFNTDTKTFALITGEVYGSVYNFNGNGSITYQGNLYFFGPNSRGDTGLTLKRYNGTNNTWSTTASFTTTGGGGIYNRGIVVGTAAYFFGGGGYTDKVIKYDFSTGQFTLLPLNRHINNAPGLVSLGDYIYTSYLGDVGQIPSAGAYDGRYIGKYNIVTNIIEVASNVVPPKLSTILLYKDNNLYLVGGQIKSPSAASPTTYVIGL